MKIVFTDHALFRMEKRKLLVEEVIDAIKRPLVTLKRDGKYYYKAKLDRGTFEVCCEKTERNIKVITLYWD